MDKNILFVFLLPATGCLYAQPRIEFKEIRQVDSIAGKNCAASHFAVLYSATMQKIEEQLNGMDPVTKAQIRKLELNFAWYFLQACRKYNETGAADTVWNSYFKNSAASPLQLKLLGINAHINGDLWQALKDSYRADEIKGISKTVFLFQRSLVKIYNDLYAEAKAENKKFKTLHTVSLGLAKGYGRHLLIKWRKRQIKLATFYYFNQSKFERLKTKTTKKKKRIDKIIIRKL